MTDTPVPTPAAMATLWRSKYQEFAESRKRTRAVRDWLAGRVDPVVPKDFHEAARMGIKLPQATTLALHTVQLLSHKRARLERTAIGKSITARRKASELQLWTNAAVQTTEEQHGKWWRPLADMLFNQGMAAVLCFPATAGWENWPDFIDDAGNIAQQRWERNKDGLDRNSPSLSGPFRVNKRQSKAAYDDYMLDWKLRNIPIVVRVIGVDQCLPVLGPGRRLDGLIVRSQHSVEDLAAEGYRWRFEGRFGDRSSHVGVGFDPDYQIKRGLYPQVTKYEYWQPGRVTYFVGYGTTMPATDNSNVTIANKMVAGKEEVASVDLAKNFGITRMPGVWLWGAHFASETDPDYVGVPFLWPFLSVFAGMNNLATADLAHTWQHSFGGWFIEPGADMDPQLLVEKGRPRRWKVEPMKAQVVPGTARPAVHPGTGKDVEQLINLMMGAVHEEGPSSAAGGGPGAASGHDRTLIRQGLEDAYSDCLDSMLEGYRFVGSMTAEIADALSREFKTSVPVYVSAHPPEGSRGVTRTALEFTEDLCDGVYDFDAEYPAEQGENLPWLQQLMQLSIEHRIPLRQALEKGMADESPDETMIEILTERLLFETQEGLKYIFSLAAQEMHDEKMQELFDAVESGQATLDGTPTAALPQGPATLPGMNTGPTAAQAALGGIVAGGLQTAALRNDAQATANGVVQPTGG